MFNRKTYRGVNVKVFFLLLYWIADRTISRTPQDMYCRNSEPWLFHSQYWNQIQHQYSGIVHFKTVFQEVANMVKLFLFWFSRLLLLLCHGNQSQCTRLFLQHTVLNVWSRIHLNFVYDVKLLDFVCSCI